MNLAVIGATGYVGDAVVRELAARGHNITAFARNPAKVLAAANVLLRDLQARDDLNWSLISPPARLGAEAGFSEERTGKYRLGQDDLLMDGDAPAGISVADLAVAIADDVERKAHLRQRFTVAGL